jgi:hypothetical protein
LLAVEGAIVFVTSVIIFPMAEQAVLTGPDGDDLEQEISNPLS